MKHILLILSLFGLTACSKKQVKNNAAEEIYAAGSLVEPGQCGEVTSGWFGDFPLMFHKVKSAEDGGKEKGDWIGKEDGYSDVSHYVVNAASQDEGAVSAVEANPCEEVVAGGDAALAEAKEAAVNAANEAKAAADAAVAKAEQVVSNLSASVSTSKQAQLGGPAQQKLNDAKAVQTEAGAVVEEANAADTVEKANAAKAKADGIKAKAEAI